MNIASKAFCRTFQFCFHLALPVLPYREPKVYNSIDGIVGLLKERKIKAVLLVTDKGIRSSGNTAYLEKSLEDNDILFL